MEIVVPVASQQVRIRQLGINGELLTTVHPQPLFELLKLEPVAGSVKLVGDSILFQGNTGYECFEFQLANLVALFLSRSERPNGVLNVGDQALLHLTRQAPEGAFLKYIAHLYRDTLDRGSHLKNIRLTHHPVVEPFSFEKEPVQMFPTRRVNFSTVNFEDVDPTDLRLSAGLSGR
jgi:hypothetical protein